MEKKRTDVDFSNHVLKIVKNENVIIYDFAIPKTYTRSIRFINTCGILAITGDYGNWIFCREFHPSEEGVSDTYWVEKLKISSTQDPYNFDSDEAQKQIKDLLENEDYDFSDREKEWLSELSWAANEGEYQYIATAMDRPGSFEAELIPRGKVLNIWLSIIFDAFDEICQRTLQSGADQPTVDDKELLRIEYIKTHGRCCGTCDQNPVNHGQRASCHYDTGPTTYGYKKGDIICNEKNGYPEYVVATSIYSIDIPYCC